MSLKLKWHVQPAPTGPYRSFQTRGWPSAEYQSGEAAVILSCETDYSARVVREASQGDIKIGVADYQRKPSDKCSKCHGSGKVFFNLTYKETGKEFGQAGSTECDCITRQGAFRWRALKTPAKSLDEAKRRAVTFLEAHPEFQPKNKC